MAGIETGTYSSTSGVVQPKRETATKPLVAASENTTETSKLDRFELKTKIRKRLEGTETIQLTAHTLYRLNHYLTGKVPYPTGEQIRGLQHVLDDVSPPVLLWVHLMEPHTPWLPIGSDMDAGPLSIAYAHGRMETNQERLSECQKQLLTELYGHRVESCDRVVGDLLGLLDGQSWNDDCLLFLTADHGEELQERGYFGHAHMGAPPHLDPVLTRVPAGVRAPGKTVDVHATAGHVDIAPTIVDWFGEEIEQCAGTSLLGTDGETRTRRRWSKYSYTGIPERAVGCTTGKWRYVRVRNDEGTSEQLYDLESDPYGTENLIDDELFEEIDELRREARQEFETMNDDTRLNVESEVT